ncbi:MAG: hypothetical protein IK007_02960 [Lachnospiraceae bacterium]|jgi:hypothetical protein|nr:hypothetical protein [Lachnospiraceae bacterium]MBR4776556.1 hypothetical protein [Lachnospiraceae bacterium]
MEFVYPILIAVVVGLIIAFILTSGMRAELTSVRQATEANIYIKDGSFNLTNQQDLFICKKVEKTEKPKPQQQQQR